jgi:hypothetical protein
MSLLQRAMPMRLSLCHRAPGIRFHHPRTISQKMGTGEKAARYPARRMLKVFNMN